MSDGTIYVTYNYSKVLNNSYLFYNNATTESPSNLQAVDIPVNIYYNIGTIITLFILLRIYHFFRAFHTFSYWNTIQAQSICKRLNTVSDIGFGLKAYLKIRPYSSLLVGILVVILIFGIYEHMFEYYNAQMIQMLNDASNPSFISTMKKFENLFNSFWLILVTMSTSILHFII